uniref:Uncharacterized protein n=1 Tax=Anguilla anguilla TaxID=7936 RepID=A0A0E9T0C7_ANGAN
MTRIQDLHRLLNVDFECVKLKVGKVVRLPC